MAGVEPFGMAALALVNSIAATYGVALDQNLLAEKPIADLVLGPLQVHIPSVKRYSGAGLPAVSAHTWPAVSLTGPHCELQCEHCQANVLKTMQAATTPDTLWRVASSAALLGAGGMLLSGGSNRRNELPLAEFLPVIGRIKAKFPAFRVNCHTGFIDQSTARGLATAGVDCVMLDIIGALDTLRQVYHLKQLTRVEASLAALTEAGLRVVPHIVAGLHFGRLLGEWAALELVRKYAPAALVLVVAMPHFAAKTRHFISPDPHQVGRLFFDARRLLPSTPVLLGCARPPGNCKAILDLYAVWAGFAGIAYPSEPSLELARGMGRAVRVNETCCSMTTDVLISRNATKLVPKSIEI